MERSDFWFPIIIWTMLQAAIAMFIGFAIHMFNSVELWEQILCFIASIVGLISAIAIIVLIVGITYSDKENKK